MSDRIKEIQNILNLRSNESIGQELADRQLNVICKSFEYLSKPGNNIIYIADEVGLGKTYIAAGIAMLLRHFSEDVDNHRDVIIVPKKNLQEKWQKELNNFITNNYLADNDRIKQQIKNPHSIKNKLSPVSYDDPVSIYRMTSFSVISSHKKKVELYEYLLHDLFKGNELAKDVLDRARSLGYFNAGYESDIRKIAAYIMNVLSPKINCLIIDEAHNYKYGLGHDNDDRAIRNEITARFLGAYNDKRILNDYYKLATRVKFPLAEKVICLSATPKDKDLREIRHQFNCFTNTHLLTDATSSQDIKEKLSKFLIRGNLEYNFNKEEPGISRNQCRHEHRLGNLNKTPDAVPLSVSDGFESIFWQLLQYKSIRELSYKNNASFEIGMLAGFESYQLDIDKRKVTAVENSEVEESESGKEYDFIAHRNIDKSQDYNIIRKIIDSYVENFNDELPPHPKMSKLEDEIIERLKCNEKSLIFVRRVATAYEIERRLLHRYERDIVVVNISTFTKKIRKFASKPVERMLEEFKEKNIAEKLSDVFKILSAKSEIRLTISRLSYGQLSPDSAEVDIWFRHAFREHQEFKNFVVSFINEKRKQVSAEFKSAANTALADSYSEAMQTIMTDEDDQPDIAEDDHTQSGYFFLNYFRKGEPGFRYRTKMYRENWFDLNILALNHAFGFLSFDDLKLKSNLSGETTSKRKKKHQLYLEREFQIREFLLHNGELKTPFNGFGNRKTDDLIELTFLSKLLINTCYPEFAEWLSRKAKNGMAGLFQDLTLLNAILKGIFRNGSGLLPGFIADSAGDDYEDSLIEVLTNLESPFSFVVNEVKTIIRDYDLIVATNFQDKKEERVNTILSNLSPVVGATGQDKINRGVLAARFRMPGFPYVLATTDIYKEGEDLHSYCQNIYHYGIAWNPSAMEQRTGRIDRINSLSYRKLTQHKKIDFESMVQVFFPYISQSIEVNQVKQLLININNFIETFNDIERQNAYDSSVTVDSNIKESDIPKQIRERLKSLYDVDSFNT